MNANKSKGMVFQKFKYFMCVLDESGRESGDSSDEY